MMMTEKITCQGREKIIEVRSSGGKLLYKKTRMGYEIKCPRTKQICLIKYEHMLADCLQCLFDISDEKELLHTTARLWGLLTTDRKAKNFFTTTKL